MQLQRIPPKTKGGFSGLIHDRTSKKDFDSSFCI